MKLLKARLPSKSIMRVLVALALLQLVGVVPALAEDGASSSSGEAEVAEDASNQQHEGGIMPPKLKVLKGFGKYSRGLKVLCRAVEADGRWDWLSNILNLNAVDEEGCFACQSFFRVFSSSCDFPKKIFKTGEKPNIVIPKKQREPNTSAIDAASRTFEEISQNARDFTDNYKAIQKLLYLLRTPRNKSEGEKEYFMILSQYVAASFDESTYEAKLRQEAAAAESEPVAAEEAAHDEEAL